MIKNQRTAEALNKSANLRFIFNYLYANRDGLSAYKLETIFIERACTPTAGSVSLIANTKRSIGSKTDVGTHVRHPRRLLRKDYEACGVVCARIGDSRMGKQNWCLIKRHGLIDSIEFAELLVGLTFEVLTGFLNCFLVNFVLWYCRNLSRSQIKGGRSINSNLHNQLLHSPAFLHECNNLHGPFRCKNMA